MPDGPRAEPSIPWPTLFAAATAIGGLVWYFGPLTSSRPMEPSDSTHPKHPGYQEVDARLWQDPLDPSTQAFARDTRDGQASLSKWLIGNKDHEPGTLLLQHRSDKRSVLMVMVEQGAYAEAVEHRRRQRNAVVNGLNQAQYVPDDPYHIGYIAVRGWRSWIPEVAGDGATNRTMVCSYEWFRRRGIDDDYVAVLWLDEGDFSDRPLIRLQNLFEAVGLRECSIRTRIIGPRGSNVLFNMTKDALSFKDKPGIKHWGDSVRIFSPTATAPDEFITYRYRFDDLGMRKPNASAVTVSEALRPWVHLDRTTVDDFDLCFALVDELKRRGVDAGRESVAVISEWDQFYGRMLPIAFQAAATGVTRSGLDGNYRASLQAKGPPRNLHFYSYLRGLDGKLPQNGSDSVTTKTPEALPAARRSEANLWRTEAEAPEGQNQYDYLRRVADQLQRFDREDRAAGGPLGGGIKAIGVLGSDVYDKLLILQALRPYFPDAVFFTTDLDARLGSPTEWAWAHNLVIASSYGLTLRNDTVLDLQQDSPPFRDSGQTAVYVATLAAMNSLVSDADVENLHRQPVSMFEVGRSGPYYLGLTPTPNSQANWIVSPRPEDALGWWSGYRICMIVAAACLAAALLMLARVKVHPPSADPLPPDFWRVASRYAGEALLCFVVSFLVISIDQRGGVPFAWFEGISLWPSELIRLLAVVLAAEFLHRGYRNLITSNAWLGDKYFRPDPGLPATEHGTVSARGLWTDYCGATRWAARYRWTLGMLLAYMAFGFCVALLFGFPRVPYRSVLSHAADVLVLLAAVGLFGTLSFFVVYSSLLAHRLIRDLSKGPTTWPEPVLARERKRRGLPDQDLREYLDVRFIAKFTEPVMHLIYYPFIILTLLIVARFSVFSDWTWPASLIVIFGFNSLWAIYSATVVRWSAENARRITVKRLRENLVAAHEDSARSNRLKTVIKEIESIRQGAFASYWHNPVIGAVLFPASMALLAFIGSLAQGK